MARDRQRAKQRKARRAAQNPGPAPSEPHRSNVPGELEHASGEVDEFDAALVAGAQGRPADDEADEVDADRAGDDLIEEDLAADDAAAYEDDESPYDDALVDEEQEDFEDEYEDDDEADATPAGDRTARASRRAEVAAADRAHAPARGGPARFMSFLRASWAELQRVQWPDRRQVFQATAVVLGFVVIAGVYLGVADKVAQEVVDLIIRPPRPSQNPARRRNPCIAGTSSTPTSDTRTRSSRT